MRKSKGSIGSAAVAVLAAGLLAGTTWAESAGSAPPKRRPGIRLEGSAMEMAEGGALTPPPGDSNAPAVDATCNFIGLTQSSLVNDAYAGGTSSTGVTRTNLGIRFTGATVLTGWNGCCAPDANIAYAPSGEILLRTTSPTPNWGGITFAASNSVPLTVAGYVSADGTGSAIGTVNVPANVTNGIYSTWTPRQVNFNQPVRSIRITGTADRWGVDTVLPILNPTPSLAITTNATSCTPLTTTVSMDVTLSNVATNVVAGQIALAWNPAKLQPAATNPITSGDSPFTVFHSINASAGTATILVSIAPGSTGGPVPSKVVARLRFVAVGGACDGSGTSVGFDPLAPLQTGFTDGFGGTISPQLTASPTFVVDDGAPVLTNVPANVTRPADAGSGNFASVTLTPPTVSDACSPTQLTSTRSDGQALSAPWPVGTTTVTWRAVDPCGNTTQATTTVTIQPVNTMNLAATWVSPFGIGGAGAVRPVTLNILGSAGAVSRTVNASVAGNGSASFSVTDLPVANYSCVTVEDVTRSLRRRVAVTDGGTAWTAASATLVLGDVIADEVIDVLDWGAYVVTNPNADLNSDGAVNATDGNIILANFGQRGDSLCGSGFMDPPQAITSISVAALAEMGLGELVAADINRDGVLDETDIELYVGGAGH